MSLLVKLAKVIIRSGVDKGNPERGHQVNSGSGKNRLMPIRHLWGYSKSKNNPENKPAFGHEDITSSGYKPELFKNNIFNNCFIFIGALITPVLGQWFWIKAGIKNIYQTTTTYFTYDREAVYIKDRRYKSGVRQEGYKKVKKYFGTPITASASERLLYVTKGLTNFLLVFVASYIQYYLYQSYMEAYNFIFNFG